MSLADAACHTGIVCPHDPTLEGGCACGAVRYRLASAPMFVNCCHCTGRQRESGSAFVINVIIETDPSSAE